MENKTRQTTKILVVEDDPFIADIYLLELESKGYSAEVATNGREAIEKLGKESYDLILLDVVMPEKDGFSTLSEIKANPSIKTPVIILSNLGQESDIKKAMSFGADDYIVKTHFTPREVLKKIEELLKKSC